MLSNSSFSMKILFNHGDHMDKNSITILHLSDIQFGVNHRFGLTAASLDGKWDTLLERLKLDLGEMKKDYSLQPDLVVMTGDLAEWGKKTEFEQVFEFVVQLAEFLNIGRERIVLVPGNHDINRDLCSSYFSECKGNDEYPVEPYWKKWELYKKHLFDKFYLGKPEIHYTEEEPWTFFEMDDLKIVVAGINSTIKESHIDGDHYGFGGEKQYRWFAERLQEYEQKGWLRIAVLHHNQQRGAENDDENLRDADCFHNILSNRLNVVLHGHVHAGRIGWLTQKCPIIATGSAALKKDQRPDEVPNQYQYVRIKSDSVERWCRAYSSVPGQKKWIGDTSSIMGGNEWKQSEPVLFDNVYATFKQVAVSEAIVKPEINSIADYSPTNSVFFCAI